MSEKKNYQQQNKMNDDFTRSVKAYEKKMKSSQAYNSAEEAVVTAIAKTKQ